MPQSAQPPAPQLSPRPPIRVRVKVRVKVRVRVRVRVRIRVRMTAARSPMPPMTPAYRLPASESLARDFVSPGTPGTRRLTPNASY